MEMGFVGTAFVNTKMETCCRLYSIGTMVSTHYDKAMYPLWFKQKGDE